MTARPLSVRISVRQHQRPAPLRGAVLRGLLRRALRVLEIPGADLRIVVVGDAEMERWHREYLGRGGTTTVLSFPEDDDGQGPARSVAGDIVLCASDCLSRTREWRCSKEDRVFFFALHGVLHLLGYDHAKGKAEASRMRRAELRVYRSCLGEGRSPI